MGSIILKIFGGACCMGWIIYFYFLCRETDKEINKGPKIYD